MLVPASPSRGSDEALLHYQSDIAIMLAALLSSAGWAMTCDIVRNARRFADYLIDQGHKRRACNRGTVGRVDI
jgi:hypothetical protein